MIPDSPEYGSGIGFFTGAFGGSRGFGCGDLRHEVIRSVVFEAGNQFASLHLTIGGAPVASRRALLDARTINVLASGTFSLALARYSLFI